MTILDEIKASFREGSVITRLIYMNLGVFLLFRLIYVIFFLAGKNYQLIEWFELPSGFDLLVRQPWSIVTYMFLHFDFLHILFNLLVLYWFGRLFLDYFDQKQLLGLYFIGGIAGGALYVLLFNLLPAFRNVVSGSFLLGASASIIAILIAAAFRDPNREIHLFLIGRVPLKYLALFMIFSYIIGISTSNAGGNIAHLGGVLAGYIFVAGMKRGRDFTTGISAFIDRLTRLTRPTQKMRVVHRKPPSDDYEYNRQRNSDHAELNRILDKIASDGYDSLSKEEKATLFRHGK
jgi:membrane associated rhomboid family serine protease